MGKHIAIAGLPRSGSTLLYCLLMNSMKRTGWAFFDKEEKAFEKMNPDWDICTKKPSDADMHRVIDEYARDHEIDLRWIITVRDVKDILVSGHPEGKEGYAISWDRHCGGGIGLKYRYQSILSLMDETEFPFHIVNYEDLVRRPDEIQRRVFPESMVHGVSFSRYGEFQGLKQSMPYHEMRMHGVRPIDQDSIRRWVNDPGRVIDQLGQCPELIWYNMYFGYMPEMPPMKL